MFTVQTHLSHPQEAIELLLEFWFTYFDREKKDLMLCNLQYK